MTLLARVAPPVLFGGRRAGLLIERNLLVYRRGWLIIVSGFFEPLFYLLSIGLGIGALVGGVTVDGGEIPYTAFVAPALALASATTIASDSRCALLDFALGLYELACPDSGRADGPLVFHTTPCTRAAPPTPPQPPARFGSGANGVAFAVT